MADILSRREIAEQVSDWILDRKIKARFIRMVRRWRAESDPDALLPLPFTSGQKLSLEEKYAVLAAIHDTEPLEEKEENIDPWPDPMQDNAIRRRVETLGGGLQHMENEDLKAGIPYCQLKLEAEKCKTSRRLTRIFVDVAKDISEIQTEHVEDGAERVVRVFVAQGNKVNELDGTKLADLAALYSPKPTAGDDPPGDGKIKPDHETDSNPVEKLSKRVDAIDRRTKKMPTKKEREREVRRKFISSRVDKKTWPEIATDWLVKPKHEWNAEYLADAMRLFWDRYGDEQTDETDK